MKNLIKYLMLMALIFTACQKDEIAPLPTQETSLLKQHEQNFIVVDIDNAIVAQSRSATSKESFVNYMSLVNESLSKYNIQLSKMEYLGGEEAGNTVFFNDRGNKQLTSDWVPNDPRNFIPGITDVPYWVDGTELGTASGMSEAQTLNAINSASNTWSSVTCSEGFSLLNIGVTTPQDFGDVGLVQNFVGLGGQPFAVPGTILHAGILPRTFFDIVAPGAIAVTFTFVFTNQGELTDIDQNGKNDTSYSEIYYDGSRSWQDLPNDGPGNGIRDFETVVLHEIGHGLSQGHFGKAFVGKNGKLHFSPLAIMNAGYSQGQREIKGTDEGGHCSIWENWPYE